MIDHEVLCYIRYSVTLTSPDCFARGSCHCEQQQLPPPIWNAQYARHLATGNSRMLDPCASHCNDRSLGGGRH